MDQLPILTARTFVGPAVEVCKVLRRGASRCRGEAVMCRPHALRSGPAPDFGQAPLPEPLFPPLFKEQDC